MKVYTYNDKVLTNSANGKWLKEKEVPVFVMNGSNAIYVQKDTTYYIAWQAPTYPDEYNGNGKQYILVNNNTETQTYPNPLTYATSTMNPGPEAISSNDMYTQGTSTGVLKNNQAFGYGYGSYIVWPSPLQNMTLEQAQAYMANVSITIIDA